jgi:hypothetical protein
VEAPFTSLPSYPLPNFPNYTASGRAATARVSPIPGYGGGDDPGTDAPPFAASASFRAAPYDPPRPEDRHARPVAPRTTEWVRPPARMAHTAEFVRATE